MNNYQQFILLLIIYEEERVLQVKRKNFRHQKQDRPPSILKKPLPRQCYHPQRASSAATKTILAPTGSPLTLVFSAESVPEIPRYTIRYTPISNVMKSLDAISEAYFLSKSIYPNVETNR